MSEMYNMRIEKIRARIAELQSQAVEKGRSGEEYDTHKANKPIAPYRLQVRCYYEAVPLYEFLIGYTKECSTAGKPVPFDLTILERYERYIKIMMFNGRVTGTIWTMGFKLKCCVNFIKQMLNGELPYLKAMETLVQFLDLGYERYPSSRVNSKRQYKGDVAIFDALVERYCERIDAHIEESHRIARENVRKRGLAE